MKMVFFSVLLILALTNQAFGMGWMGGHGGGGGGGGAVGTTSSNTNNKSGTNNNSSGNSSTIGVTGAGNVAALVTNSESETPPTGGVGAVPELATILLLGSGLAGLWGFRRKIKK
jgi:hypothetical protein